MLMIVHQDLSTIDQNRCKQAAVGKATSLSKSIGLAFCNFAFCATLRRPLAYREL
jgi:hypothetical protein